MAEGYCEITFRLFLGIVRTVRDLEDAHCMSYRTGGALQDAHFVRYRTLAALAIERSLHSL